MKSRRAFTLIEFLVVLAIIAVILAFLLPALVGARSASRRTCCINNMKQLELALQSYLNNHNVLPSGSYDTAGPVLSEPGGYKVSWIVSILPYMEQSGLFRAFDPQYGADDPVNQTVRTSRINSLQCPDDGSAGRSWFGVWPPAPAPGLEPGKSSYAACHHDVEAPIDDDNHGAFFLNSHIRVVDVSDGLSQTIFIGEMPWGSSLGWVSGTRATLRNTGHPINGLTPGSVPLVGGGSMPLTESLTLRELEQRIDANDPQVAPTFVGGFGSTHPGKGANFGFGDGSVRFLRQTIDPAVYQRLGHRCDREAIDDDTF